MRRSNRILITVLTAVASVGLVLSLVFLGSATAGPLVTALNAAGGTIRTVEARITNRVRGPGRVREMAFVQPLRSSADSLRAQQHFLLGAFDAGVPATLQGVLRVEELVGQRLPLMQVYTAWGDRADQRFPGRIVQAISELGSIPLVTWEPWLTDFENRLHPHLPLRDDRDRGGLAAIASGAYDFYIDAWAREAARFGRPFMLRFGHEFNDPYRYPWGPHNNRPDDFIAAWRHVVDRFRAAGAHNAVWVWAPHLAYGEYEWYYPGDGYVDWVATGVLNYGTVAQWSEWWTFEEIFGQHYEKLAAFGKPIMIAEFGTLAVGGERAEWFGDALRRLPERYPQVKALLFFHVESDRTVTYQALDWSFDSDPASVTAIRNALAGWRDAAAGGRAP
jgi:hypothetical protein